MSNSLLPESESQLIRALYPVVKEYVYLDLGGRSPISAAVKAALGSYLDDCMYGRVDKAALFEETENVRSAFAQLINAKPEEVTYTKNTSEGLNIIGTAIQWQPGDNLVICPELEHPNNIYLWLNLRQKGVEIKTVQARDGFLPIDDMISAIDSRTRLVTTSSVSFVPGFRAELSKLGKACREKGALLLVDATQSVGVLHTDVEKEFIDAMAISTQKGLMALYGMGFLYVRKEVAEQLKPTYLARFGVDLGDQDAPEYDFRGANYALQPGARRFDLGNYNFAGVRAAGESLRLIQSIGSKRIESHVLALSEILANGFMELGLPVCGGKHGPHSSQIVTIGEFSAHPDETEVSKLNALYEWLAQNRVKLSIRRGMLRFSMHVYNDVSAIQKTLDLTKTFLRNYVG